MHPNFPISATNKIIWAENGKAFGDLRKGAKS